MNRILLLICAALLEASLVGSVGVRGQAPARAILFDPVVPIADRLLPNEKQVLIYRESLPGLKVDPRISESFDQEIRRLRRAEIVAIVQVSSAQGELTADGTWVRTKVNAGIDQLVQAASDKPLASTLVFGFSGGSTLIGEVRVTAGTFLRFTEGERYLVFLITDPGIKGLSPSIALRVNSQGMLQRLTSSDGTEQKLKTNLVGRNVSDVVDALVQAK